MQQPTFEFIEEAHDVLDLAPDRGLFQPDIYDSLRNKQGYDGDIKFIYFYYIRIKDDGSLEARHYHEIIRSSTGQPLAIDYDDVPGILTRLMQNAIDEQHHPAPETQSNFRGVEWRRRSYIALAIDEKYWKLYKRESRNPPVTFLPRMKDGRLGTPNHTFFDAKDLELDVVVQGRREKRSAIFFINHYKRDTLGNPIYSSANPQHFHFNIYFDVAFSVATDPALTVIFDPGGTNQGPALQP